MKIRNVAWTEIKLKLNLEIYIKKKKRIIMTNKILFKILILIIVCK